MLFGLTSGDLALLIVAGSVFSYVGYYLYLQLYKRYVLLMAQLNKVVTFIDKLDNLQNTLTYLVDQNEDEFENTNWKPSKTSFDIKNKNQYTFNDEFKDFKPKTSTGSILNKLLPNENNAQYYALLGSLTPLLWSYVKDYVTSKAFPTLSTNFNSTEFMEENPEIMTEIQQKIKNQNPNSNFNAGNFNVGEFIKENPDIATKLVEKVAGFKQGPAYLNNAVLGGKYKVSPWMNSTVEPNNWANEKDYNPDYIVGPAGSTGVVGPMAPNILKNYKNMFDGGYMGMEGNPIITSMYICPECPGCPGCFPCPSTDTANTNVKHSEPNKCSGCLKCVSDQDCAEHDEVGIPKNYAEPGLSIPKFNKSFGGVKSIENTEYDECAYKSPKQSSNGTKLTDVDVSKINMSIEI
jgi:hypothetical protein